MLCPCDQKTELTIQMTKQGVEIDFCRKCKGIWLDKGELFYFVKNPKIALKKFLYALDSKSPSEKISPISHKPMVEISYPDGPKLDYCEESGGVWLDKNELNDILATDNNMEIDFDSQKYRKKRIRIKKLDLPFYFFRSFLAIIGAYLPLICLLTYLMFTTHLSSFFLLSIIFGYAFLVLAFSGKIMDFMLKHFFSTQFKKNPVIPVHLDKFIKEIAQKYNFSPPTIGIIEDPAPQCFCYGTNTDHVRLIFTRGALETLNEKEIIAIAAHEMGHIVNRDVILMTIAQIFPLTCYYFYRIFWYKNYLEKRPSLLFAIIPSIIFYLFYAITQFPVLWFSRVREYYADVFAAKNIGNPNDLSRALVKIAYGIASKDCSSKGYQFNIEAAGAMGIFDKSRALNIAINSYPNQLLQDINKDLLKKAMRWSLWNPWSDWYELFSTHPSTSKRIINLSTLSKNKGLEPFVDFPEEKPSSYFDEFITDLTILILPITISLFIIGYIINLGFLTPIITPLNHATLSLLIIALGVAMMLRNHFHFRGSLFPIIQVSTLLKKVKVSEIRPVACTLQGKIIGKGVPGFLSSKGYVFEDESGILMLDNQDPIHLWERFFSTLDRTNFNDRNVIVEGWYHRDEVSYLTIKSISCDGKTYYSYKALSYKVMSTLTTIIGSLYFAKIIIDIIYL